MKDIKESIEGETLRTRLVRVVVRPFSDGFNAACDFVFDVCAVAFEIALGWLGGLVALAVVAFTGLGVVGLLWFGINQLF